MQRLAKRFTWAMAALLVSVALTAVACGSTSPDDGTSTGSSAGTSEPGQAAGAPHRGGTMVFAIGSDPQTLNPALTTDVDTLAVACKMFNGLVYLDKDWTPQPELATSWDVTPDGKKITFHLRHGVSWQDGKQFTSADVKFTFTKVLAKYNPRSSKAFANVTSVDTPDDYTVVVNFSKPYGPFLEEMTCQDAAILPAHIYDTADIVNNPRNVSDPIGTGPFKFDSWAKGDHIRLVRNDNYFRKGQPYLDAVVAKIISDPTSRVQALESGDVDFIQSYELPKNQVGNLKKDSNVQLGYNTDLPGNYIMFFNTKHQPLDQAKVRQALATGLNRKQLVQQALFGVGEPGESEIHRALKWASDPDVSYSKMYPYDPAKAKSMLDAAGLKPNADGVRFSIRLVYDTTSPGFNTMAQIIRDNWKDIGVKVVLVPQEAQLNHTTIFKDQDYDVTIYGYTTAGDPALGITRQFVCTKPGIAFTNPTGYCNSQVDQLAQTAAETLDQQTRAQGYFQIQQIIGKDLPVFNMVDRTEVDAADANLRGLWQSAEPYDLWGQVWWATGTK